MMCAEDFPNKAEYIPKASRAHRNVCLGIMIILHTAFIPTLKRVKQVSDISLKFLTLLANKAFWKRPTGVLLSLPT